MCFFLKATATTEIYTYDPPLPLHDALPISGEDVLLHPRVLRLRAAEHADGVDHGHAVRLQQARDLAVVFAVMARPDMLQHADRDDAVILGVEGAVVAQDRKSTRLNSSH